MKNTIYVEGIKRYLMSENGVNSIVARLSAKYKMLPQQFIRRGDDEIKWNWSDEDNKLHTSKLRYYPEYDEYKFRVGRQWYSLNDALRYNFF